MTSRKQALFLALLSASCTTSELAPSAAKPPPVEPVAIPSSESASKTSAVQTTTSAPDAASPALEIPTFSVCLLKDDAGVLPALTPLAQQTCPQSPPALAVLKTEILGIESIMQHAPRIDPDRPALLYRLAKKYAEWECSEHVVCIQYPNTGSGVFHRKDREAAARVVRRSEELCTMLRADYPRFPQRCP